MNTSLPPKPPELLNELSKLEKSGKLGEGVRKAEHFTAEDAESASLKRQTRLGKTTTDIKQCAMWICFSFGVFLTFLLGLMLFKQVIGIIDDAVLRSSALVWLWTTLLTVLTTLFIEKQVTNKKRK